MSQQEPSRLVCYTSDQIPYVWEKVEGYIKRGLDRQSEYCSEDLLEGLCNKSMQLWCWIDTDIRAAMVTTIQNDDEAKWCLLLCIGGDSMSEWKTQLPIVEKWAKENGCTEMRIYGRIGWAKALGYGIDYARLSKGI